MGTDTVTGGTKIRRDPPAPPVREGEVSEGPRGDGGPLPRRNGGPGTGDKDVGKRDRV